MTNEIIYLTQNSGFLFTEMNDRYGLLSPSQLNIVDPGPYLRDSQAKDINASAAFERHASSIISQYLKNEGTYELYVNPLEPLCEQDFFSTAGATQLQTALTYSLSMTDPQKKYLIVEKIPYFTLHESSVKEFPYNNVRFQGFNDPSEIILEENEILVEYITSPNNPDGAMRFPETNANIIFADFVFSSNSYGPNGDGYISKNLAWMKKARNEKKLIFSYDSASKHFGRAGDRWGYLWYPKYHPIGNKLFDKFSLGMFLAGGDSTTSGAQLLNYISQISRLEKNILATYFKNINTSLHLRYNILSKLLLERYTGSIIETVIGTPFLFLKLKDDRIPIMSATEVILLDTNTMVSPGTNYGVKSNAYIRFTLLAPSFDLAQFCNRLTNKIIFTPHDFLVYSENICTHKIINCEFIEKNKEYIINPNDCIIDADTDCYPIKIILPKFNCYEFSKIMKIRKINDYGNKLTIVSEDFTINLCKKQKIKVQWINPLFQSGKWVII